MKVLLQHFTALAAQSRAQYSQTLIIRTRGDWA